MSQAVEHWMRATHVTQIGAQVASLNAALKGSGVQVHMIPAIAVVPYVEPRAIDEGMVIAIGLSDEWEVPRYAPRSYNDARDMAGLPAIEDES